MAQTVSSQSSSSCPCPAVSLRLVPSHLTVYLQQGAWSDQQRKKLFDGTKRNHNGKKNCTNKIKWGPVAEHVGDGRSSKSCSMAWQNFTSRNKGIDWNDKTQWQDKDWNEFVWPGPPIMHQVFVPYANARDSKRMKKTIHHVITTTSVLDYPDLSYEENRKLQEEYDWKTHVEE